MSSPPPSPALDRLLLQERFAEALYFGALALADAPSPRVHLCLALACAGALRGVADVERELAGARSVGRGSNVGRDTLLAHEALGHIAEALRRDPALRLDEALVDVARAVRDDLAWFVRAEEHGLRRAPGPLSRRAAGAVAGALLDRLLGEAELASVWRERVDDLDALVRDALRDRGGGAAFHAAVRR